MVDHSLCFILLRGDIPTARHLSIEPDRMKILGDRRIQSQRNRVVLGGGAKPAKSGEHEPSRV